nr:helix-turn-helix domain-containing protein [uncultured Dyadobacter sp.]
METGYREKVDPQLNGVLNHFYLIETQAGHGRRTYHLSPNLEMMLVFNFGAPVFFSFGESQIGRRAVRATGVFGPLRRMLNYELTDGADLLVLNFTLNGFYRFFSVPMDGFEGDMVSDEVVSGQQERLEAMWNALASLVPHDRIQWLNAYLPANLFGNEPDSLPLLDAAARFHQPEVSPVKAIAREHGITERTVQGRFRKYVGYTSKELIRFLRFKEILRFLLAAGAQAPVDWAMLVEEHGYHDQSHLIKDFKYYTGMAPRKFMKMNEADGFCMTNDW